MTARLLEFRLLGTGSSGGVPRVGGDWGACDPNEPKNRRSRCSALLRVGASGAPDERTTILIDTAPDLREQLLKTDVQHLDAVVYTHDHADQSHGIDDVRALAIRNRSQIDVYMDAATQNTILPKFRYAFEGEHGYPAIYRSRPLIQAYQPFDLSGPGGAIEVLPVDQEHGYIRSLGFRFGDVAYCNDLNAFPQRTLDALQGLELLVIDALRYTPHPSHAHLDQTLDWIAQLRPKRAVLTNMHVDLDYQTLLSALPAGVEPGYDGWTYRAEI
ncbi:MAG: MBL fold metallo-hydrolase [Pseudomonadota bacterium]